MATATPIYDPSLSGGGGGGFTPTGDYYIPFGNVGHTTLIDSAKLTFNDSTNTFALAAAAAAGAVTALVSNTSNTASATAVLTVKVAGATAASPKINLDTGTSGHIWTIENLNSASNDPLQISWDGFRGIFYDMLGTGFSVRPTGSASLEVQLSSTGGVGGLLAGTQVKNTSTGAGSLLSLNTAFGTSGGGVGIAIYDTVATVYKYALSTVNRAGPPELKLIEAGGNVLVGGVAAATSLARGISIADGTAASADPSGGGAMWSASSILSYRGSGATTGVQNLSRTYRAIANANSTVTIADDNGVLAYTSLSASDKTCTLPNLATVRDGFQVTVYLDCVAGGFKVTVSGDGNIVGVASFLLDTDYEAATFVKNATDWTVI